MSSPFVFDVAELLRPNADMPEQRRNVGPSPSRIGPEMIAVAKGDPVTVEATLTPLGSAVMADADISARLTGECVRCLAELHPEVSLHVSQVFGVDEDFVNGEQAETPEDAPALVVNNTIDLEQAFTDEAGLNLPFNPTCEGGCENTTVPGPDGVSGEEDPDAVDPRWAGLEKFL